MSGSNRKRLRVFAGPNGSGKSTLFAKFSRKYDPGVFVNADEIENSLHKNGYINLSDYNLQTSPEDLQLYLSTQESKSFILKSTELGINQIGIDHRENCLIIPSQKVTPYSAAYAAAFIRWTLFQYGKSFSMETVMSHPSKIQEIKNGNELGYKTYLYFVCTDDPIINIDRVEARVRKGGHSVDVKKIVTRYQSTLQLLKEAVSITYRSYLFDNSGQKMILLAESYNVQLKILEDDLPYWFTSVFQ